MKLEYALSAYPEHGAFWEQSSEVAGAESKWKILSTVGRNSCNNALATLPECCLCTVVQLPKQLWRERSDKQ